MKSFFQLPVIEGLIKRRMLVNFRADPGVVQKLLPPGLRPKLHAGHAIAGMCLIRLEQIRMKGLPAIAGFSSENAAHRIAVEWDDGEGAIREGVFIPRRDTDSALNALAGGRIFPGEHHHSKFQVSDSNGHIDFLMTGHEVTIQLMAEPAAALPDGSCFGSISEASVFFESGCVGYSVTCDPGRFDGIRLETAKWEVGALAVKFVESTWLRDPVRFPAGSLTFDHALIMRDIPHEWHSVGDLWHGHVPVTKCRPDRDA